MSTAQEDFLKWFGGIASALIIASILGVIGMYYTVGVQGQAIEVNARDGRALREYHKEDAKLIRDYVREIRADQKEMKSDIKELLKK